MTRETRPEHHHYSEISKLSPISLLCGFAFKVNGAVRESTLGYTLRSSAYSAVKGYDWVT
jgi:hypothetical protein